VLCACFHPFARMLVSNCRMKHFILSSRKTIITSVSWTEYFSQLAPVHQDRYLSQYTAHVCAAVLRPDRDNVARHRPAVRPLQVASAYRDHLPIFYVPYYM